MAKALRGVERILAILVQAATFVALLLKIKGAIRRRSPRPK